MKSIVSCFMIILHRYNLLWKNWNLIGYIPQKVVIETTKYQPRNVKKGSQWNDTTDMLNRINQQHGVHTIEHAEKIGLGSRKYTLVSIDK